MTTVLSKYSDWLYAVMRFIVGASFAVHGAQKLFGVLGGMKVPLVSLWGLAGVIEFFGGVLVAIGLFASVAAFVASGEMAAAFFTTHLPKGFWPILNGGELAVLYCFVFLYIAAHGAGICSLDKRIRR